jgi:hypothetical protein
VGIEIYTNKVISEHKVQPNFIAWLSAALEKVQGIKDANIAAVNALDIDLATGSNLDMLGTIVGVNRHLSFQPVDGSSPILDDTTYRFLMKSKIEQNKWQGTNEELYTLWINVSESLGIINLQVVDNQDMSFTVNFLDPITIASIGVELIMQGYIIPKPEGVKINFSFTISNAGIILEEHIFERQITRHTILGVWHLGVDPFATAGSEEQIK